MASSASTGSKNAEDIFMEQKKKTTEMVRIRFARFGDDILAMMLGFALQPTRMPTLLERLELRITSQDLETRLDRIAQYIGDWGSAKFKDRALAEKKAEVAPMDLSAIPETLEAPAPVSPVAPPPRNTAVQTPVPPGAKAPAGAPQIRVAGYTGPDRRSKSERRTKADRRGQLDAISSNKRFGGDRRKSAKGRRKEDQPKPDFWWKQIKPSK